MEYKIIERKTVIQVVEDMDQFFFIMDGNRGKICFSYKSQYENGLLRDVCSSTILKIQKLKSTLLSIIRTTNTES